ncbi:hypothetical protein L1N85_10715 [Paenibacillus alkaliterrae]|uniref:hypothetical protein n=1 Tax=Paenibacillus alkaliterrae TaxID=320909 RepID=UPI001F41DE94|nr:hypothetical protein [Paenibacillus alkaliterrae]MCF2938908.1 hypothetical protein [Paenibacillus alkaliterrae]
MPFVWRQNSDSRQPKMISNIKAKASTTFTYGQTLQVVSGRWESAVADGVVGGIYNGPTFTSGAEDFIDVIEARPGDEFVADYTGTPDAAFLAGQRTADIAAGGLNLNAADVLNGAWAILSVDTANTKAIVRPKNRQLS